MNDVRVYGADECQDTRATLYHLDSLGVQYQYINIQSDSDAAEWVRQQSGGAWKTPVLDIQGQILAEPDERQLADALRCRGLMG